MTEPPATPEVDTTQEVTTQKVITQEDTTQEDTTLEATTTPELITGRSYHCRLSGTTYHQARSYHTAGWNN